MRSIVLSTSQGERYFVVEKSMVFQKAELKKPRNYNLDLSQVQLDWPLASIQQGLNQYDRVVVEVGCGTGQWSLAQAQRDSKSFYLAIERTHNKSSVMLNSYHDAGLPNLLGVQADAIAFIAHALPQNSVDQFDVLYPNPTPKKRQANHRFFVGPAFHVFHHALKPQGQIVLATNIIDYLEEAESFLKQIWHYDVERVTISPHDFTPRTAFEKKYFDRGEKLYELRATQPKG